MTQRRILLGYQVENGKAMLNPETAPIIREIFVRYLNGDALGKIAKWMAEIGVLNANGGTFWSHGLVSQLLDNPKYLGDDFYPPLISPHTFELVKQRRIQRSEALGMNQQFNRSDQVLTFTNKITCAHCGTEYRKYLKWKSKTERLVTWRCKRSKVRADECCRNVFLKEEQIMKVFETAVNQLITRKSTTKTNRIQQSQPQSYRVIQLSEQLQKLESSSEYSAEMKLFFIMERARVQYQAAKIDDGGCREQQLKSVLADIDQYHGREETLFREIVRQVIVGEVLTFQFMDGTEIPINIEENRKGGGRCSQ